MIKSEIILQNQLIRKINQFLIELGLQKKQTRILIALSGGPDSVFLLEVLHMLGYELQAAHVNYRLRDAESDSDEALCKQICNEKGIKNSY